MILLVIFESIKCGVGILPAPFLWAYIFIRGKKSGIIGKNLLILRRQL